MTTRLSLFASAVSAAFALLLVFSIPTESQAATPVNCYRDTTPTKLLLGKEKRLLSIQRNYIAYPRDILRNEQPFVVLAARRSDQSPVCRPILNELSEEDFQLHLTIGDTASLKSRLAGLLKQEYPVKVADNEDGFTVWRSLYTTSEAGKTYYYEMMVPVAGATSFKGFVICTGESITGTRLDRQRCTAHESYEGLILQYKFVATTLSDLPKWHQAALNLVDKLLENPQQ